MALVVKLEHFEGPLDLLLYFIERDKVDIYDIPIVQITQQYLDYLEQMKEENLNIMSEFLVMAATLIDIKCKMLLPKEVDEDGNEEDPRDELVQQLLEYKMYKYMSYELKDRQLDAAKAYYKGPSMPQEILDFRPPVDYDELLGDMTLQKLNHIFQDIMKRQEDRVDPIRSTFGKLEKDEISLSDKQHYIFHYLSEHEKCSFRELLEKQSSKMEVIVSFLVVLELMKIGEIEIVQDNLFDDIWIYRTDSSKPLKVNEDFAIM